MRLPCGTMYYVLLIAAVTCGSSTCAAGEAQPSRVDGSLAATQSRRSASTETPLVMSDAMTTRTGEGTLPQKRRGERAIGICSAVDYNKTELENVAFISPGRVADEYFVLYEDRPSDPWKVPSRDFELVVKPKHGKVDYIKHEDGLSYPAIYSVTGVCRE